MMAKRRKMRRQKFERVVFLKMTKGMHDALQEFAARKGLTISAAIRLLIAEGLEREGIELKEERTGKE